MNFSSVRKAFCAIATAGFLTCTTANAEQDILNQLVEKGVVIVNMHDQSNTRAILAGLDSDPTAMAIKSTEIKGVGAELAMSSLVKQDQRQGLFVEESRFDMPGVVALSANFGEKIRSASMLVGTIKSDGDERAVVLLNVVTDAVPEGTTSVFATADDLGAAHLVADALINIDAEDVQWVAGGGNGLRAAAANHPCFNCPNIQPKNPAPGGGPKPNGCTGVPNDLPGIFDFTACCNDHDMCYSNCSSTQSGCDKAFRGCMDNYCKNKHPNDNPHLKQYCKDAAKIYYWGVRLFGTKYFCAAQQNFCECVAQQ